MFREPFSLQTSSYSRNLHLYFVIHFDTFNHRIEKTTDKTTQDNTCQVNQKTPRHMQTTHIKCKYFLQHKNQSRFRCPPRFTTASQTSTLFLSSKHMDHQSHQGSLSSSSAAKSVADCTSGATAGAGWRHRLDDFHISATCDEIAAPRPSTP